LALYDVLSDVVFIVAELQPHSEYRTLYLLAVASLAVAFALNLAALLTFLRRQLVANAPFRAWFNGNRGVIAPCLLLATTKVDTLELLASHTLGPLNAPLDDGALNRIKGLGVASLLLEDVPQVVITLIHTERSGGLSLAALLSLVGTAISIAYSLVTKSLALLLVSTEAAAAACKAAAGAAPVSLEAELAELAELRAWRVRVLAAGGASEGCGDAPPANAVDPVSPGAVSGLVSDEGRAEMSSHTPNPLLAQR
jgi:hypothetical protein